MTMLLAEEKIFTAGYKSLLASCSNRQIALLVEHSCNVRTVPNKCVTQSGDESKSSASVSGI